jgi:hypothetical protein
MIRYTTERHKANRVLDLNSLTMESFETLIPAFGMAFVGYMEE